MSSAQGSLGGASSATGVKRGPPPAASAAFQGGGNVDLHPARCARCSHVDGCVQVVPDILDFRHICGQGERVVGPAGSGGQWGATDGESDGDTSRER